MLSVQELRSSTKKELFQELEKSRKEMLKFRIGTKTKHIKDSTLYGKQTRYIAKIKTVIREIEIDEEIKTSTKI